MNRIYALMACRASPIYGNSEKLVQVYESQKEAKTEAERRNKSRRTSLHYWVESTPFVKKEQK